jgi:hypothetical protein
MKIGKSETDKIAEQLLKCRQIATEILDFGVSQDQIMQIIYLLSLELENRDALLDISEAVSRHKTSLVTEDDKPQQKILEV